MDYDLIVVGGGPVGSRVAAQASKRMRVLVLEEHDEVGLPIQCAGLVSPRVVELAEAKSTVLNRITGGIVHFPGGSEIELGGSETKAVVVDRKAFDVVCYESALRAGAEFSMRTRFLSYSESGEGLRVDARRDGAAVSSSCSLLVGADGYKSSVAREAGIGPSKDVVRGIQADIDRQLPDQDRVHVYLGRKVAPGFFGWVIPCGGYTRVGVCVSRAEGAPSRYLRSLIESVGLKGCDRVRVVSGMIPMGPPARTYHQRVLVVGDAAGQAKPLSGGGLYTGMVSADCAALTAVEAFDNGDFTSSLLSSYQTRWRAVIGKELDRGYRIRKLFTRLSDKKIDEAGRLLNRGDVVDMLSKGDIDFPCRLVPSILGSIPSLLRFSPQILGSLLRR